MWILERMHGHQLLTRLSRMSLEHGHITAALLVGSVIVGVGTLLLLRWLPRRAALVALGLSVLGSATGATFVWLSFRPLPAQLPASNFVWIALAMFGVIGAALVLLRRPGLARGLSVTAFAGLAAIVAVGQVNAQTGTYPTLGSLVGHWPVGSVENVAFDSLPPGAEPWVQRGGLPTETHWQVPVRMPSNGVVTEAAIPGNVSGFDARPATLYLPPAYLADPRAELPVLVLVAGEPGSPSDWLDSGRLATTVDAYASRHFGLAPVVVVPDALGGDYDANPRLHGFCPRQRRDVSGPGRPELDRIEPSSESGRCAMGYRWVLLRRDMRDRDGRELPGPIPVVPGLLRAGRTVDR